MFTHSRYESKVQVYEKKIFIYSHIKSQNKFLKIAQQKDKTKRSICKEKKNGGGGAEICSGEGKN